jgi:hypothetical protein
MISILHISWILKFPIWQFTSWFRSNYNWWVPWWQEHSWIRCMPSIKSNMWIKLWSSMWVSIKYIIIEELKKKLILPSIKHNPYMYIWSRMLKFISMDPLHNHLYYHLEYGIGCYLPYVVKKTMVEKCQSFTWLGYKFDYYQMQWRC